ncbi:MAG: TRAP transporter large permease subunit [Deltaproteobacteria bacterium]|nr:TRAP transporter large permease subunit [Deltaproteobacteria bacterium]
MAGLLAIALVLFTNAAPAPAPASAPATAEDFNAKAQRSKDARNETSSLGASAPLRQIPAPVPAKRAAPRASDSDEEEMPERDEPESPPEDEADGGTERDDVETDDGASKPGADGGVTAATAGVDGGTGTTATPQAAQPSAAATESKSSKSAGFGPWAVVLTFLILMGAGAPLFIAFMAMTLVAALFAADVAIEAGVGFGDFISMIFSSGTDLEQGAVGIVKSQATAIPEKFWKVTKHLDVITIPLFTIAGAIMTRGGISGRLVRFARALVGFLPGGLAVASLTACVLFAALTGSSAVTIIAIGGIIFPALVAANYPQRFSLGLMTTGGAIGILVPPSLPLIIYSIVANQAMAGTKIPYRVGVNELFIAGVLPGILCVVLIAIYAARTSYKFNVTRDRFSGAELWAAFKSAALSLLLPVILLVGLYGGFVTAVDLSAIAVVYAFVVEVFIHREIKLRDVPSILVEAMELVGSILVILLAAFGFTWFMTDQKIPDLCVAFIKNLVQSPELFLLAVNVLLLIVGCLMDVFSALVVVAPLIVPLAFAYNINLVHLGIIFVVNLEIGFATPPFGINLFISSSFFKKSVPEIFRATLPYILLLLAALLIVTYVPGLATWLVPAK